MSENIYIPPTGFLRLSQILLIVPVSRSSWWRGVKSGRYPKPIKLGERITAWSVKDITSMVESLNGKESTP